MKIPPFVAAFRPLALLCLVTACNPAPHSHDSPDSHSHDDHEPHEPNEAAEAPAEVEPQTITHFGPQALLFMEFPPLVRDQSARFLAHLTVLADGEPVRSGRVTLTIGATTLVANEPRREGLFIPEGSFPTAGTLPARLVVESDQVTETLELGTVVVHATEADMLAAQDEPGAEPPGAVPFLLEQQWKVKALLAEAGPRQLSRRLVVPARVIPAEGAAAVVTPPVQGRLVQPAQGGLPRTGDDVKAGQILAFVEPPLGAPEIAQLRALEWEVAQQALDVDRAVADAEAQLRFAAAEQERIAQLRKVGLSTQQQLDEADRNLALAHSSSESAQRALATLGRLRPPPAGATDGAAGLTLQLPVSAPIGGVVTQAGHVVGEFVEPSQTLFRIVDPSRLWIEGRVSEFDLAALSAAPQAIARFTAAPQRTVALGGQDGARLLWISPEVEPSSRTVTVRFELPNQAGELRAGMLADLELVTGAVQAAVVIPGEAVVMDQGMPVAYVMLEGELFQKRDLQLGVRDGDLVEIRAGIQPGERVATRGAATIRLVSMSPASFGAGHAH